MDVEGGQSQKSKNDEHMGLKGAFFRLVGSNCEREQTTITFFGVLHALLGLPPTFPFFSLPPLPMGPQPTDEHIFVCGQINRGVWCVEREVGVKCARVHSMSLCFLFACVVSHTHTSHLLLPLPPRQIVIRRAHLRVWGHQP
jgi:hypothetical protein